MLDENGYEMNLENCEWGSWEKMTDVEVDCWMRKCTTCKNFQTTSEDPTVVVEKVPLDSPLVNEVLEGNSVTQPPAQ